MPQKIHVIYVLSPQISYDTKEQARTFDTLVLFVPYNEPYLQERENGPGQMEANGRWSTGGMVMEMVDLTTTVFLLR